MLCSIQFVKFCKYDFKETLLQIKLTDTVEDGCLNQCRRSLCRKCMKCQTVIKYVNTYKKINRGNCTHTHTQNNFKVILNV